MSNKTFADFQLIEPIQRAVADTGYTTPTPIQGMAIPLLLEGRDLLGCAQTGTGKTAAFALPILNHLAQQSRHLERRQVRALILTPTRELAVQIQESFRTYGKHLRVKSTTVFGGVSQSMQVRALSSGVDVLVATPGRLLDLIQQKYVNLSRLEIFVLDEADRMLDMGFINDIRKIIAQLPAQRQTLLFSATMPSEIRTLASTLLRDPAHVEVKPVAATVPKITQSVMYVERTNKRNLLMHILKQKETSRVIIFTRTKHGANRIVELLADAGVSSDAIHGNKTQGARQRALNAFRVGRVRALVATDVMARGIDIDDVTHVINFDVPNDPESYVHRIGRTGRAGAEGFAISFCDPEERGFLRDIEKLIGGTVPMDRNHPYHSEAAMLSRDNSKNLRYNRNAPQRQGDSQGGGGRRKPRGGFKGRGGGGGGGRPGGRRSAGRPGGGRSAHSSPRF